MFGTIRKHQTWLWIIIIIFMILGLVIYFSPTAGTGQRSSSANFGSIDGVPITQTEFVNARREAYLAYFFATGNWPDTAPKSGFDPERETYQRLFFLRKINEYNIHVDMESVAEMANNILAQLGRGRPVPLDAFVDQVLKPRGATAEDFQRYIIHYLGLQQLLSVVGVSGELVAPQEAQALYVKEHQEIASSAVFFSGTNYMSSVTTPTPQVLSEFYTNQMAAYRLPERVQISYVSFDVSNYLAQVEREKTNLTEEVNFNFTQLGTNYSQLAKTPEAAKEKIRELLLKRDARALARRDADAFANVLFEKEPMRAENLAELAKTRGLKVHTTAPFEQQDGPAELDGDANIAKEAFRLTAEEPFAGPLLGENGVYVFALARRVPSEVPPLASVHDRVVADYKQSQAISMARRAGTDFARTATQGLAQGKTFASVVTNAGFKPVTLPPISLSTTNVPQLGERVSLYQFRSTAFETAPGKVSNFTPTAEGGFVVYVDKRLPVDTAKMNAELPEFLKRVRQARRQEAISAWFQREGTKALRDTPLMQTQPGTAGAQRQS